MTFPERLLHLALERPKAEALLGDLEEEAARRGASRGWVQRQILRHALSSFSLAARRKRIRMLTAVRLAFRDARRSMLHSRATSIGAVLILALSMAAGAVAFAVVDTIVLRPLPYADSGRLVAVSMRTPREPRGRLAAADYYGWRAGTSSLEHLAAWQP
jgi:hypothetical protein